MRRTWAFASKLGRTSVLPARNCLNHVTVSGSVRPLPTSVPVGCYRNVEAFAYLIESLLFFFVSIVMTFFVLFAEGWKDSFGHICQNLRKENSGAFCCQGSSISYLILANLITRSTDLCRWIANQWQLASSIVPEGQSLPKSVGVWFLFFFRILFFVCLGLTGSYKWPCNKFTNSRLIST